MLQRAKIKILVVPIQIDALKFQTFFNLLQQSSTVILDDKIYFDFVTANNTIFQDLELSEHIYGTIGLMDCQGGSLSTGVASFKQYAKKPSRLFGFQPSEDQQDDIPGLIMIPNVGSQSFYLSTMITDFARDLISNFDELLTELNRKELVQGPILVSPQFKESDSTVDTSFMASMVNPEKTKKRTKTRVLKMCGDVWLLRGKLDNAIECFASAVEGCKVNADPQFQASALEGFMVSKLLLLYYQVHTMEEDSPLPTMEELFQVAKESQELTAFLCEVPERYREIIKLYDSAYPVGVLGYYPIFQIHSILRCVAFLTAAVHVKFSGTFLNGAWIGAIESVKSVTGELARIANTSPALLIPQQSITLLPFSNSNDKATFKIISKVDIFTWISRVIECGLQYLSPQDQVFVYSWVAIASKNLKSLRKYAFYLYQVSQVLSKTSPGPALMILKRICLLLQGNELVDDDIKLLEEYHGNSGRVEYGWPSLQTQVYKNAIALAKDDINNSVWFSSMLLKKITLSRKEKAEACEELKRAVMYHRKPKVLQSNLFQFSLGTLIVRKMTILEPLGRYIVTQHNQVKETGKSIFLYSPFAKANKEKKVIYVGGEVVYVDVDLANPYLFDVDVQRLELVCNDGVKCVPVSTLVPAETRLHTVRLSCIAPPGILSIKGVSVKMLGGCVEEIIIPLQRFENDSTLFTKDGSIRKILDQTRYGSKKLKPIDEKVKNWEVKVPVIEPQPMLEVCETSLGSQQALTLFEGESSKITLTVRNIGSVPVNYLYMKIQEHNIDSDETGYENEVYRASVKAFTYPVKDIQESKADQGVVTQVTSCGPHTPIHIPISLGVGEELILPISVFGKKDCTGATITLNYGHVEEGKEGGFYTREVSVPILTTVVCAMSFRNVDVLHSTKTIDQVPDTDDVQDWMLHPRLSVTKTKSENTFLLTFDLANEWDEVFQVSFEVYDDSPVPILTQTTLIHPNVTKRIILPITRITVPQDRVQQPIPTLPGKQFVVSEKEYHEGLSRALFWYKEEFVGGLQRRGRLVMKWVGSNNRSGYLSFRSFQMTPAVLSIIKTDVIEILGTVLEDEHVTRTNNAYTCKTNGLTRVQWKITNHSGITS